MTASASDGISTGTATKTVDLSGEGTSKTGTVNLAELLSQIVGEDLNTTPAGLEAYLANYSASFVVSATVQGKN